MKRYLVPCSLVLVGFAGGMLFVGSWLHGQPAAQPVLPQPRELTSYRDIVKRVLPAVVFVETYSKNAPPRPLGLKDNARLGFGSGFFVDPAGVIVTNYHVVEGADTAVIQLHDGRKLTSKNIRSDRRTDLAIIVLDVKDVRFPTLQLGDSEAMEIGDRVLAVGAPFGLAGSVTQGIVSGKGRSGLHMNMYEDFLQTDAAINPGNSGGPLIDLQGKVVGISAAIKSKTGGFQGVGLAVASNLAKTVVPALQKHGVVKRGYLGAHIRDLTPEVADKLGLAQTGGVVIAEVFDKTPAAKAGLKPGDILTTVSGKAIKNADVMQRIIALLPVDQAIDVDILRDGKLMRLTVVIEEQPASYGVRDSEPAARRPDPIARSVPLGPLGFDVAEVTDAVADDFGLRRGIQGVVITRIHNGGLAAASSLRPGTIIAKIDDRNVATPLAAVQALEISSLANGVVLQTITPQGGVSYVLMKSLR